MGGKGFSKYFQKDTPSGAALEKLRHLKETVVYQELMADVGKACATPVVVGGSKVLPHDADMPQIEQEQGNSSGTELDQETNGHIGHRVSVYWQSLKKWYPGTISQYDAERGEHEIEFDDGDIQPIDITAHIAAKHLKWL
jgi:hypothetical protein